MNNIKTKTFSVKEQSTMEHGISAILQNAACILLAAGSCACAVVTSGKLSQMVTWACDTITSDDQLIIVTDSTCTLHSYIKGPNIGSL